ncbi:MAG: hypothetical protein Q8R83_05255 [Legionellaceae bacterium]|nr:hypothetical protein [Legionellaceae bacterium]
MNNEKRLSTSTILSALAPPNKTITCHQTDGFVPKNGNPISLIEIKQEEEEGPVLYDKGRGMYYRECKKTNDLKIDDSDLPSTNNPNIK